MKIITAPDDINERVDFSSMIFLAGSIAEGTAENWQNEVMQKFDDYEDDVLTVLNPRREEFNTSVKQTIDDPELSEQVNWELDGMDEAVYILVHFHPDTQAPITLLELGLHAKDRFGGLVVCCPDGFYRQGNVEIVCQRYDIPFFKNLDDAVQCLRNYIDEDHNITR